MHAGHDMHAMHGHDHSGHAGHDHSGHGDFKKQFWWSLVLTLPIMFFSMTVHQLLGYPMPVFFGSEYIPAVLGVILFFTGGRVFLKTGWQEIKARQPGMMALIAMAIIVAFVYSSFITIVQTLGIEWAGMDFWWELAALISIMLLGHWIEMNSIMRAQNAVGELAKLVPNTADLIQGDEIKRVATALLKVGDLILVRPGSAVAADGEVVDGSSELDESMVTGESREVRKSVGDSVVAGTINGSSANLGEGTLTVRVTRVGGDTMIAGIMRLVAEAQASKSKTQLLADRAASWLFYVATIAAALTAVLWPLLSDPTPDFVLERVVTVLVIACPHALGLAIPLVTAISSSKAAKNGLLIRDRKSFEALRNVDVVVFDKTGTLTEGKRNVAGVYSIVGRSDSAEMLRLAAAVEQYSEHSLARAIVAHAGANGELVAKDFRVIPGVGVTARIGADVITIGGPALLTSRNLSLSVNDLLKANEENALGRTVVFVLKESELLGFISVGDVIRDSAIEAVEQIKRLGKHVVLLSGDAQGVVNSVANKLGITEVYGEVLPHQKSELVKRLQADGKRVAMVGDGINDAPALAQAEVGLAIGSGTDVAIESAGLLLVSSDPLGVAEAIKLSRRTYSKMIQNLVWGAGYNVVAIPLAAGAFAGLGFVLSPALGAVLMSLSTIIVAANAQLLRR
ncbi:MAG: heavy metal translocating P-type ATPase [Actinobacteria bacterium]|nr:heavy metal translocating P-type ATPase [Actinomycetota bacterium]